MKKMLFIISVVFIGYLIFHPITGCQNSSQKQKADSSKVENQPPKKENSIMDSTLLNMALAGDTKGAKNIIEHGGNPKCMVSKMPMIHYIITRINNNAELKNTFKLLIDKGADIHEKDANGINTINLLVKIYSIKADDDIKLNMIEIIKYFMTLKPDINLKDKEGLSAKDRAKEIPELEKIIK